jgi:hypothetical protein
MVAIMMMTFLFFFCFVVNVGMLVNAKIQLQNAADLAAYAGAAAQARQLNRISFLNYEMRRQFKKFLFRYYVIGNMAQRDFPTSASGTKPSTPYKWMPDPTVSGAPDYQVPAVCIVFNSNDNYCHVHRLPEIKIPPPSNFDLINDALRNQLQKLEAIRTSNCDKIAFTNLFTLALWLYNGDPSKTPDFDLAGLGDSYKNAQSLVQGLVKGLGLIPREILLRQRIKTLERYLNEPAKAGLKLSSVQSLGNSADPHRYERTIQAFNSAFYTLGDHTFGTEGIVMDELQSDTQIKLNNIQSKFDTWAIYFDTAGAGSSGSISNDCNPHLIPQSLKNEVILGVAKDPTVLTYYAVRLRAKAKLLFNPWGAEGIELKAYSAAQPFGSRIGPALTADSWVRKGAAPAGSIVSTLINPLDSGTSNQVPNLVISEDDSLDKGWNTREVLGLMLSTAFPSTGPTKTINEKDLGRAYQIAMAPNPYETKVYNIPNDMAAYDASHRFSPGIFDSNRAAILWAPIAPPDSPSDLDSELKSIIEDLFHDVGGSSAALKDTLKDQLTKYVNSLKSTDLQACANNLLSAGLDDNDCESFNRVRLTNPMKPRPNASATSANLLPLPAWFMPQTANEVLTSWNSPNDPAPSSDAGRLGYSVKFISFDSLVQQRIKSDTKTGTSPQNPPGQGDEEAKVDMSSIQH